MDGPLRRFPGRVEGVEALRLGRFKQLRRGGDEDDLRAVEHVASHQRGEFERANRFRRGQTVVYMRTEPSRKAR